jgi:hypothetical protein
LGIVLEALVPVLSTAGLLLVSVRVRVLKVALSQAPLLFERAYCWVGDLLFLLGPEGVHPNDGS